MIQNIVSPSLVVKSQKLKDWLHKQNNFADLMGLPISFENGIKLNLSTNNPDLSLLDLSNTSAFSDYIQKIQSPFAFGVGGYDENRMMYQRSMVFGDSNQSRSVHLGVDIWGPAGTKVYCPMKGKVHSFNYNSAFGDYGATIILQHDFEGDKFYTLYGHLTLDSILSLKPEQEFEKGMLLCAFGVPEENGHWPPHLHFQIMIDMLGNSGDFPGVSSNADRQFYLTICPNPNLIIRSEVLI